MKKLIPFLVTVALVGCGVPERKLMVTPVLYHSDALDPLSHVDASHRTTSQRVFYATNRDRIHGGYDQPLAYGNQPTDTLQLGMARIRFGETDSWEALHAASRGDERQEPFNLRLTDVWEHGSIRFRDLEHDPSPTDGSAGFFKAINAQLAIAKDPELILYVHGAKVNFYDACVFAAELNHFAGRDMVPIAFSWPTHQDILRYLSGEDVARARASVRTFESLLRTLAERTTARRINIVCWSAGGRVVSRALEDLSHWEDRLHEDPADVRIGAVVFAAPDVPVHDFVARMPEIERVSELVVVTASDDDNALEMASVLMAGGRRIGTINEELPEEELEALNNATRLELVDVSGGKNSRGFDITGHRYWFSHAWVASDVILAVRTRLPAESRGLKQSDFKHVWYFPPDYPDRVRTAALQALHGTW